MAENIHPVWVATERATRYTEYEPGPSEHNNTTSGTVTDQLPSGLVLAGGGGDRGTPPA